MKHANIVKSIFAAVDLMSTAGAWAAMETGGDRTAEIIMALKRRK